MRDKGQRRKKNRSLDRKVGNREELRTIVVFTEGKNSEPDYVNALKRLKHIASNVALSIEIHPEHGVPLTLVENAVDRKADSEIDECWCIFDVEWPKNHPNLKEATALAEKRDINLAISNPCFEVWLILHHENYTKWCDTSRAESYSRSLDGRPGKSIVDISTYMKLRSVAAKNAENLDIRHFKNDTKFPNDNPSSGMHKFLRALEGDIKPEEDTVC